MDCGLAKNVTWNHGELYIVVLVSICIDFMDMVNDDVESNLEYHEH